MILLIRFAKCSCIRISLCAAVLFGVSAAGSAQSLQKATIPFAPDLDLSIQYYSRVLTQEGVLRENRYEEKMLRRPGHVWVARVLPVAAVEGHDDHDDERQIHDNRAGVKKALAQSKATRHEHKHFNPVILPRHVTLDGNQTRVEFIDAREKEAISIAPTEYENVSFDGSWANAYYLIDPQGVAALPLSSKASPVAGARWHEREKNGLFQRVLWDDKKMIPLIVETGDKAGTFFRRVEVKPQVNLTKDLPWQNLKAYAQKEYSDFLD